MSLSKTDFRNYFIKKSEAPRLSSNVSGTEAPGPASASVQSQPPAEQPGQARLVFNDRIALRFDKL